MFELIELDNKESFGMNCLNKTGEFSYDGIVFYFDAMRSSRVLSIKRDGSIMIVRTKNSEYTFREVE